MDKAWIKNITLSQSSNQNNRIEMNVSKEDEDDDRECFSMHSIFQLYRHYFLLPNLAGVKKKLRLGVEIFFTVSFSAFFVRLSSTRAIFGISSLSSGLTILRIIANIIRT